MCVMTDFQDELVIPVEHKAQGLAGGQRRGCQNFAKQAHLLLALEFQGKQKSGLSGMSCHRPSQITAYFHPAPQLLRSLTS